MFKTIQCAVQGRGHERSGVPCQDKTYSLTQDGVSVVALADGAGSATLSHLGAESVTRTACRELVAHFERFYSAPGAEIVRQELLQSLLTVLALTATEHDCALRDLASTLLVVAVKDSRFLLVHLGDGVIGFLRQGELKVASHPTNGEFANETCFVTSAEAGRQMKLFKGRMETIRGFVLMSDGTEASLYDKRRKELAGALGRLICATATTADETEIEQSLELSLRHVLRHYTQDDCSLALLVDDKEGFSGYRSLPRREKCRLLGFKRYHSGRKYTRILEYALNGKAPESIAKHLRLKARYTQRCLERLVQQKLLVRKGALYQTNILM